MAYSALVSLTQTADLILNPDRYRISVHVNKEITSIREHAISLVSGLEESPEKANRLEGKIRDIATEAEDIIEDLMMRRKNQRSWWSALLSRVPFGMQWRRVRRQLKRVREEFVSIAGEMMNDQLGDYPAAAAAISSRLASTGKNDTVIGLKEELIAIKGRLCGESSKLDVIPILGMGGIGKTTLARCAYDDQLTVEHFYIRAWATISQDYSAQQILSCLRDSMKSSFPVFSLFCYTFSL